MREASLGETTQGLVPEGDGWFVVNARRAAWHAVDGLGRYCRFEGKDAARFEQYGINIHVLEPGEPSCMYHGENEQEDFLVLAGECSLLVEGEERRLRQWDFVHCPPWTEHVFVGAGSGPCAILMVGARKPDDQVLYPVEPLAQRYGAGVDVETRSPDEAYARFPSSVPVPYREGDLPGEVDRPG
jgi:uncharacterized cupin superfamily protein